MSDPTRRLLFLLAATAALVGPAADAAERPLYVAEEFGGRPTPLVLHDEFDETGSPDWSPDGSKVAYDGWRSGRGETYVEAHVLVVNADGSGFTDLGDGAMPSWSADGTRIAFTRYSPNYGAWTMNADGSDRQLIDDRGWCGQWSPDGKTIAYTASAGGRADVCLYDVATGEKRYVFNGAGPGYATIYWNFCWSPDSKRLAFKARTAENAIEVATVSTDGPAAHFHVHHQGPCDEGLAWHPEGDRILIAIPSPAHGDAHRLHTFAANGSSGPSALPGLPDEFLALGGDWAPDGRSIVFPGRPRPIE